MALEGDADMQQRDFGTMMREPADWLPGVLIPLLILVVGFLVAYLVGYVVRRLVMRARIGERLARAAHDPDAPRRDRVDVASLAGKVAFFGVLLFVFMAFVEYVGMSSVAAPAEDLLRKVFAFVPNLLGALLLAGVAWVIASLLRVGVRRVMLARVPEPAEEDRLGFDRQTHVKLARSLAETAYWLVFLLFLPAILSALGLEGMLGPVRNMMDRILVALPDVAVGALLIAIGWFVARVVQRLVTSLLETAGVDRLSARVGMSSALGETSLASAIGMLVFVLVFVPALIAGLNAMGIDAIAQPATAMLGTMLDLLPRLLGAAIILVIAYVVGRLAGGVVQRLLEGIGFDSWPARLGIAKEGAIDPSYRPSRVANGIVVVAAILVGAMEASATLGFESLEVMLAETMRFGVQILVAAVIVVVGLAFANVAARAVRASQSPHAETLANVARVSILVLAAAMALRQVGLADEIVNLAFGLVLGAIAVASALAFGLGGREAASRMLARLEEERPGETPPRSSPDERRTSH